MKYLLYHTLAFILFFTSCVNKIPQDYISLNTSINIYPDYNEITIPYNIAPLNFNIKDTADQYLTRISARNGESLFFTKNTIQIDIKDWKKLLQENKGRSYSIDIFLKRNDQWFKYNTITNYIATEPIDEYLSYRLIEPGYITYGGITINQRNLSNFDEREIFSNKKTSSKDNQQQCMNCHSYQNYRTDNMQIHFRNFNGGTVIISDGKATKVDTKTDYTNSGGVYPSWHPSEKLIAYSVNSIGQVFHSNQNNKVEVIDRNSDLVLYDITKNEISIISNDKKSLETWPSWSPDGKTLYFTSARFEEKTFGNKTNAVTDYKNTKYDIHAKSFDKNTKLFGTNDTIFKASSIGKSAALPRVSPDGKYLLFTLANYGNFHIWHKSSDLYLMNLKNREVREMTEINSDDVESYHSWSSNGRWIVFSTRRDDGSFTRSYIAYFDKNGLAHKPFILPQKDPDLYANLLKSFNIPEFMVEPVKITVQELYEVTKTEAKKASFRK